MLGIVAGALLYALAFPPYGVPGAAWLALVPVLFALDGATPRRAAGLGLLHGTLIGATTTVWLVPTVQSFFERPWPLALLFLVPFWVVAVGVYHAPLFAWLAHLRTRLAPAAWLALLAPAWVAVELARTTLGLEVGWEKLGEATWRDARLRQLAALGGVYLPSALVVAGNVAVFAALRALWTAGEPRRTAWRRAGVYAGVTGAALAVALAYGEVRLRRLDRAAPAESLDVVLVQGDLEQARRWRRAEAGGVLRHYLGLTVRALREGGPADLVVWPEQALQTAVDDPAFGPGLASLVRTLDAPLLVGAPRFASSDAGRLAYNAAHLLRPAGETLHYDKMRLLPFSETHPLGRRGSGGGDLAIGEYTAGTTPGLLRWEGPALGVLICFEAVYAEPARGLARDGARVLVNLSNDGWYGGRGGAEQHLNQVVFRAVETGLPIVRATTTGVTAVVGPDGRVREQLPADRAGALRAAVPVPRRTRTAYLAVGDAFAGSCLVALVVGGVAARRRRVASGFDPSSVSTVPPDPASS